MLNKSTPKVFSQLESFFDAARYVGQPAEFYLARSLHTLAEGAPEKRSLSAR